MRYWKAHYRDESHDEDILIANEEADKYDNLTSPSMELPFRAVTSAVLNSRTGTRPRGPSSVFLC